MIIPLNGFGVSRRVGDGVTVAAGMPAIALQVVEEDGEPEARKVLVVNSKGELEWLPAEEKLAWGPLLVQVQGQRSVLR